ncbi:MAG: class I SAM-dependent methyltransferase [Betaproteobacteria bacterium]|jgi:SAM-dependent methyltransferase
MSGWPSPPPYNLVGKHGVSPTFKHDDIARFNFLAQLNTHLAATVVPANATAYEKRVKPAFVAEHGREPTDRHEVRRAMLKDAHFQIWSALRRSSMELRQQNGREVVLRQLAALNQKAAALNRNSPQLKLDPTFVPPAYVSKVDFHCMPGGYVGELLPDDVGAAANYDIGIFATTAGGLGCYNDGAGLAVYEWLKKRYAGEMPKRILDLGCGPGHTITALAKHLPNTEFVTVDVAAPMLRFAHARAKSLGVNNITFIQANAENVPEPDASFDVVYTTIMLHETSNLAIRKIMAETYRLLKPGGLSFHLEQPQYAGLPPFEAFMRDWDSLYNNEPFWTGMHDLDIDQLMADAGYDRANMFQDRAVGVLDEAIFGKQKDTGEDFGRKAAWHLFGVTK